LIEGRRVVSGRPCTYCQTSVDEGQDVGPNRGDLTEVPACARPTEDSEASLDPACFRPDKLKAGRALFVDYRDLGFQGPAGIVCVSSATRSRLANCIEGS
jgi:hypothetical protein